MKVNELINILSNNSKIAFYTNKNRFYKGGIKTKIDSITIKKYFRVNEVLEDKFLLDREILMVTAIDRNIITVKLKWSK